MILSLCVGHFSFFDLIDNGQFKSKRIIALSSFT